MEPQITPPAAKQPDYISNPFLNIVRGIQLTFAANPVSSLLTGLGVTVAWFVTYLCSLLLSSQFEVGNIGFVIALTLFIVSAAASLLMFGGQYAIGGASSNSRTLSTKQALSVAYGRFWPLLGFTILYSLLVVFGLFVLIIPGLFILARGSLGFIILFEENSGPIKSLRRSFGLTSGHTHEMVGTLFAGLFMNSSSLGILTAPLMVAPSVGRYHDLIKLKKSGSLVPPVNRLNYLGYIFFGLLLAIMSVLIISVVVFALRGELPSLETRLHLLNSAQPSTPPTPVYSPYNGNSTYYVN